VAECRYVDAIGIGGIDNDLADLARLGQPD
jgi:hypothetical protein